MSNFVRWMLSTIAIAVMLTFAWIVFILAFGYFVTEAPPWDLSNPHGYIIILVMGLLFGAFIADPLPKEERRRRTHTEWLRQRGYTPEEVQDFAHVLRYLEPHVLVHLHAQGAEREAALYSNLRARFDMLERISQ